MITKTVITSALAVVLTASTMISLTANADEKEIIERVKPVGQLVVLSGTEEVKPADTATGTESADAAPETTANAGKSIYDTACFACHTTGATGAPILGNKEAWASRVSKSKDTLYFNAINGINSMPAKGGAASLSDDDVKAVVDYMVEQSS